MSCPELAGCERAGWPDCSPCAQRAWQANHLWRYDDVSAPIPHPLAPSLSGLAVVQTYGAAYHAAAGILTASNGSIYNIGIDAYPYNSQGLVPHAPR